MTKVTPWQLLSTTTALDEKWFPVRKDTVKLPSGKVIDDYFVWEAPHIVSVVPITPEGKFIVVRQYRHALGKILYQFPAGAVDPGESFEKAAKRELLEETGHQCTSLVHLADLAPYATKMTGLDHTYLAEGTVKVQEVAYDEQEESEPVTLSLAELLELMHHEEIVMTQLPAHLLLILDYQQRIK